MAEKVAYDRISFHSDESLGSHEASPAAADHDKRSMASEKSGLLRASFSEYGAIRKETSCNQQISTYFTKRDFVVVSILSGFTMAAIGIALGFGIPALNAKREQYLSLEIEPSPSLLATFKERVVATDADFCAPIGEQMLAHGGSGVDAAIATLFCNGVVHPDAMGIGGGVIFTIYDKATGNVSIIDGRERAPFGSEATPKEKLKSGPLSIAIPGEIRAYERAHQLYGVLPWKKLVQPTIDLCLKGFLMTQHLAEKIEGHKNDLNKVPSLRAQFFDQQEKRFLRKGEVIKCTALAATLEKIRDGGAAAFYGGTVAEQLVADIQNQGGNLSLDDLGNYTVRIRDAIELTLSTASVTVYSPPPPASGPILSLILNIMDGFDYAYGESKDVRQAALMYHRLIEAFKFAYAAKTHLTDEDFLANTTLVDEIISDSYANEIRRKISEKTHEPSFYQPSAPLPEDKGTAHVGVLTSTGMAVAATSSINSNFGSFVYSPRTGIILNNHMSDFTEIQGTPNSVEAGKRPMSSMVPTVIVDKITKEPILVMGGAGHTRITTGVAQIAFRHLYLKQNIKEATDHPRLHHQLTPNEVLYQTGFPGIMIDKLKSFGHKIKRDESLSAFTTISRDVDGIHANVDYRRGGGSLAGF